MPENTTTENTTSAPAAPATENQPTEPVSFKEETFVEGDWRGFKFTTPVFNTVDAAVAHFGNTNILNLINTQVSSRLRNKVKNGLPKNLKGAEFDKYKMEKLKNNPNGLLLTSEQALAWKPDAREESSTSIFKEIKDAIKAGDVGKITTIFPRFVEAIQREGGGDVNIAEVLAHAAK